MKKAIGVVVVLASAAVVGMTAGVAAAALLHGPHAGSSCPGGATGTYHFVNNQTGGAGAGTLTADFSTGSVVDSTPDKVNQNVQQWFIVHDGVLLGTTHTNLPGRLVLSDLECAAPPPPPPGPPPPGPPPPGPPPAPPA